MKIIYTYRTYAFVVILGPTSPFGESRHLEILAWALNIGIRQLADASLSDDISLFVETISNRGNVLN